MRPIIRTLVATTVVALPLLPLQGQGRAGRNRAPISPSAGELINARRALNLTPQQLVRLDSIERAQFAARDAATSALRASRDSVCANRRPCVLSREELQGLRGAQDARMGGRNFFSADSTRRALTMSILDSTQRSRFVALRRGDDQRRNAARGMTRGNDNRFAPRGGRARVGAGNNFRGPRRGFDGPRRELRNQRNGIRRNNFGPVPRPGRRFGPGSDDFRAPAEPRDPRRRPDIEG